MFYQAECGESSSPRPRQEQASCIDVILSRYACWHRALYVLCIPSGSVSVNFQRAHLCYLQNLYGCTGH